MKKQALLILIITMSLAIIGCTSSNVNKTETVDNGIVVSHNFTSLGGESTEITRVTYRIKLMNKLRKPIFIRTVEPIISKDIQDRLIDQDIKKEVDIEIESSESQDISGYFNIDTNGLSKEEIIKLETRITEFKILTEQIIGTQ